MTVLTRSPVFRALPISGRIAGHLRAYRYVAWLNWVWMWG